MYISTPNNRELKNLYLIRHSKSDWNRSNQIDKNRTLNKRGRVASSFMGNKLREKGVTPDMIIASSAVRAQETAGYIATSLNYEIDKIQTSDFLYLANTNQLLTIINTTTDTLSSLIFVAHNPGISELAEFLTGEHFGTLPTTGIVGITFGYNQWCAVSKNTGMLLFYDYPKLYSEMNSQ